MTHTWKRREVLTSCFTSGKVDGSSICGSVFSCAMALPCSAAASESTDRLYLPTVPQSMLSDLQQVLGRCDLDDGNSV